MDQPTFNAIAPAAAALAGSVVGGLTSLGAAWLTQVRQAENERRIQDKNQRNELYGNFIQEASTLYAHALRNTEANVPGIVTLFALIGQMRVHSSPRIVGEAEAVMRVIVDTYFEPNREFMELHGLVASAAIDPLRNFAEAARDELRNL
jgi:hypothetical protein